MLFIRANINGVVYPVFDGIGSGVIGEIRNAAPNAAASDNSVRRKVKAEVCLHSLRQGIAADPEHIVLVLGIEDNKAVRILFIRKA